MCRVVQHSENHSIKYHEQKFCIKFTFQGIIQQDYLLKRENSIFGMSVKMSIPVLNFSTESAKELTLYDLLFLIAIYSPNINSDNKNPSEMRN